MLSVFCFREKWESLHIPAYEGIKIGNLLKLN